MATVIHPTALIAPSARLGDNVTIGAYSIVGADVEIGDGTTVGPHVVIEGPTTIGRDNRIYQFASLGAAPQDKKYAGEPTRLEIGDRNTIREFCTFNRGTAQDAGATRVGDDNWIMAYVHLAHDCQVGDKTIFANNAQLAGHVHVGDWAILGGFTVVHQFVRIGTHCITAMGSILLQDVPPFVTASGNPAAPHGINSEGLKRRGFSAATIAAIKRAYKTLYRSGMKLEEATAAIAAEAQGEQAQLALLSDFLATPGRGIIR
jgi:UDP-N-acetylglucosamine acyltransferase